MKKTLVRITALIGAVSIGTGAAYAAGGAFRGGSTDAAAEENVVAEDLRGRHGKMFGAAGHSEGGTVYSYTIDARSGEIIAQSVKEPGSAKDETDQTARREKSGKADGSDAKDGKSKDADSKDADESGLKDDAGEDKTAAPAGPGDAAEPEEAAGEKKSDSAAESDDAEQAEASDDAEQSDKAGQAEASDGEDKADSSEKSGRGDKAQSGEETTSEKRGGKHAAKSEDADGETEASVAEDAASAKSRTGRDGNGRRNAVDADTFDGISADEAKEIARKDAGVSEDDAFAWARLTQGEDGPVYKVRIISRAQNA